MKFAGIENPLKSKSGRGLSGAVLAALAASICCVLPLLLLALGVGGAWVGRLTVLEPFRPYFMGLSFLLLSYAFYRIYKKPNVEGCKLGSYCANPRSDKINKIALWSAALLILLLFAVPYMVGHALYSGGRTEKDSTFEIKVIEKLALNVPGMTCPSCPFTVQKALKNLDGVFKAQADLQKKKAVVLYDPAKVSAAQIIKATTNAGYPSSVIIKKKEAKNEGQNHSTKH